MVEIEHFFWDDNKGRKFIELQETISSLKFRLESQPMRQPRTRTHWYAAGGWSGTRILFSSGAAYSFTSEPIGVYVTSFAINLRTASIKDCIYNI